MAFYAKKSGANSLPVLDEGFHRAVCQAVIDIGTQTNERFGTKARELIIIFELPDERLSRVSRDGKVMDLPRVTSKKYRCSLHEKSTLAKDLKSWLGRSFTKQEEDEKGFDLSSLLNKNCMLQILHKERDGKTYANIATIIPSFPNLEKVEAENDLKYFSFADHRDHIPEGIPEWIVNLIKNSEEWQMLNSSDDAAHDDYVIEEADAPF